MLNIKGSQYALLRNWEEVFIMNNIEIRKQSINLDPIKKQVGFSLVELLVSMVIGVFLLGGIITNFVSTKDSDKIRTAVSQMDADARLALDRLTETVRHAGYPSIYNVRLDKPFYTNSDGVITNPACRGEGINRDKYKPRRRDRTRDRSRGDVLTIMSLADNPCVAGQASCANEANVNPRALIYTDCLGGGATRVSSRVVSCSAEPGVGMDDPTQAKIYSSFFLGGGSNKNKLYCRGSRGGTQPMADNIQAMQFLYGVQESNGDMKVSTTTYKNAKAVEDSSEWSLVNSVQVGLLMRSSKEILKEDSDKTSYVLLDESINIPSSDRRRLFRVYTTTINLENKNKDPFK